MCLPTHRERFKAEFASTDSAIVSQSVLALRPDSVPLRGLRAIASLAWHRRRLLPEHATYRERYRDDIDGTFERNSLE